MFLKQHRSHNHASIKTLVQLFYSTSSFCAASCYSPYLHIAPDSQRCLICRISFYSQHCRHNDNCLVCWRMSHADHKHRPLGIHQCLMRRKNTFNKSWEQKTLTSCHRSSWEEQLQILFSSYTQLPQYFYSEGTDEHPTSTCNVVAIVKHFHSSSWDESITTNAGIIWTCVKTVGITSTDVWVFQTLIDIYKQNIRTQFSWLNNDCRSQTIIEFNTMQDD